MAETKPLILVVDDEPDILRLIGRILEPAGYGVISATYASQALALVLEKNPELILLDIKMPGKSGLEALQQLKMDHPDTAVVMMTGVGDIKTVVEAMKTGAFDYLVKPFSPDEVVISVEKALDKKRLILENRAYQLSLQRQLTALGNLFQLHLKIREETEEVYDRLASRIAKMCEEMQALAKETETQRERMQISPSERCK